MEATIKFSEAEHEDIIRREIAAKFPDLVRDSEITIEFGSYSYDKTVTVTIEPRVEVDSAPKQADAA